MALERTAAFAPGAVLAVSLAVFGVTAVPGVSAVLGGVVGKMSESSSNSPHRSAFLGSKCLVIISATCSLSPHI